MCVYTNVLLCRVCVCVCVGLRSEISEADLSKVLPEEVHQLHVLLMLVRLLLYRRFLKTRMLLSNYGFVDSVQSGILRFTYFSVLCVCLCVSVFCVCVHVLYVVSCGIHPCVCVCRAASEDQNVL